MLKVESDGAVLRLTMNRPEVKNALNDELIAALTHAIQGVSPQTRAIVLAGEGDAFCAGGDLNWMRQAATYTEEQNYQDALKVAHLFQSIMDCPAYVISRVVGPCFGGGCGLAAASDTAVASDDATFAFSEVKLGLVPATISRVVLPKIGPGHARALFTSGEIFDAERAKTIGLVHEVIAREDVDVVINKKLKAVLNAGPLAVASSKRLAYQEPLTIEDASRLLAKTRAGDEAKEGIAAFLEKRKPSFKADL